MQRPLYQLEGNTVTLEDVSPMLQHIKHAKDEHLPHVLSPPSSPSIHPLQQTSLPLPQHPKSVFTFEHTVQPIVYFIPFSAEFSLVLLAFLHFPSRFLVCPLFRSFWFCSSLFLFCQLTLLVCSLLFFFFNFSALFASVSVLFTLILFHPPYDYDWIPR